MKLMLRWASSLLLSALLAWTVVCGQCVLCPDTQKTGNSAHNCCPPPDCKQHDSHAKACPAYKPVFEANAKAEIHAPLAVEPAPEAEVLLAAAFADLAHPLPLLHSPPQRYLLNSVLLI
jgi:hypothetical protein